MKEEKLLELKNVSAFYGGLKALSSADVYIEEGEIVALMGPNGAGKSSILKTVFGLLPISSGSVSFRGKNYNPIPHQVVHMGVSFVPQGRQLFSNLSVKENLEMGGVVEPNKKELQRRIKDMLELFPVLKDKLNQKAGSLSGGQQQMLALARGLMNDPELLLLDEPSLGLSPKLVKEVFAKIKEINLKRKTAVFIVEHNLKSLLEIANRAYVLDKGAVVASGNSEKIINSDILERVFLGK